MKQTCGVALECRFCPQCAVVQPEREMCSRPGPERVQGGGTVPVNQGEQQNWDSGATGPGQKSGEAGTPAMAGSTRF